MSTEEPTSETTVVIAFDIECLRRQGNHWQRVTAKPGSLTAARRAEKHWREHANPAYYADVRLVKRVTTTTVEREVL